MIANPIVTDQGCQIPAKTSLISGRVEGLETFSLRIKGKLLIDRDQVVDRFFNFLLAGECVAGHHAVQRFLRLTAFEFFQQVIHDILIAKPGCLKLGQFSFFFIGQERVFAVFRNDLIKPGYFIINR